jgi:hypothetical protein
MKPLLISLSLLGIAATLAGATDIVWTTGVGAGITLPSPDSNPCPPATLALTYDGTAEQGYAWSYGGIVPPYYGAFAECYQYSGCVCGIQTGLTGIGYPCVPLDAYIWEDDSGQPGVVLSMTPSLNPCPVATWPNVSTHDFAITPTVVGGTYWIGWWADFSRQPPGYFIPVDYDGLEGCPFTNIAPAVGYPTGWHHVDVVWGSTGHATSLAIGAWGSPDCPPVPVEASSWGSIKSLYRN